MASRRVLSLALLSIVLTCLTAFATDPPGRVARLNYMSGQVSIQPNGVNDWVAANINRPLTTSDRIWTDKDSRVELQMGAATARLNGETSLTLANVTYQATQLQLDQGTLNLHVMRLFNGEIYEIDTPNLAFTVEKPGDYRLDVDNAGDTTVVTVLKGRGEATGDNPGVRITNGEQMTFRGGRSLDHVAPRSPGLDGFDSWCLARAEREDHSPALQYVSPYAVGYSDLDDYGSWETVAPYGPIWVPAGVSVGWAPYRWGHWVYIAPWGWTWVDDAPWGFVPFHYGRWVYFNNYWGWCPGPLYARPIYAPALVGWIGGPSFGLGLSFGVGGGVGWFPLGWGEPYQPWYGHSRGYFENVNVTNTRITNITYVTNHYYGGHAGPPLRYAGQVNAVTAVSNATFVGSRPTRESLVPVTATALKGSTVVSTIPMRPTRESVSGPGQHMPAPPSAVFNRPVVTRMAPSAAPTIHPSEVGRPERSAASATTAATPAGIPVGPARAYPRPPQGSAPASMATEESPRGIPRPTPTPSGTPGERVVTPARVDPAATPREYPHPATAPVAQPRMNGEEPPITRAPETHTTQPTPRTAEPQHESRPQPRSEPKSEPRAEPKTDKAGPHAGLPYPSPYTATVRPAGLTRTVPRPTGTVAHATRSYYSTGSNSARTYSARSSYSGTHSGSAPRYSSGASVSHASAPSASRSSSGGSRGGR